MFRRGKLSFLTTKDDRIKVINDRINLTEKHLIDLCSAISTCTRKQAKCRDSYDDLAKSFKSYADDENVNESLSAGLKNFTNAVTVLADYMDLEVHRTEIKIINELAQFETVCKTVRENLRTAVIARDKEVLRQKQMIEIKTKFSANTSAADSELLKAKLEVNRTNKDIDEIINNFEQRKLGDLKAILENFVLIQMKYHTKALEALSAIYYDAASIDEKYDFREFQKLLRDKETAGQRKLGMKKEMHSQSMESLDRDQLLSPSRRLSRISKSSKNLAEETDADDDAENDDGYDEHSEYDDSDNPSQDPSETDSEVAESTSRLEEKKKSLSKQKSIQPHMNSINDSGKSMKNPLGIPLGKENSGIRSSNPRSRTGNLVTIVKSKKHIDYTSDDSDDNKEYNSNRMLIQKQIHK